MKFWLAIFLGFSFVSYAQKDSTVEVTVTGPIFTVVEKMPEFPGGPDKMYKYISKHIKYPQTAYEGKKEGKCFLKFVVTTEGKIANVSIIKGVPNCPECDNECIRLVKRMPDWSPGEQNGQKVNTYYNLPFNFTLSRK